MYKIIITDTHYVVLKEDKVLFKISKANSLENVIKMLGGSEYEIIR